jgi:hypothetical protein
MDTILENIKAYVLIIDSTIEDNDFLDFVIGDVVDRALIYMNRSQLIEDYEADILDDTVEASEYVYPIPPQLERAIAKTVANAYKNAQAENASEMAVKTISDNGQSITYSDKVTNYLSSSSDQDLFSGVTTLLNKFRLLSVVENT